MHLRGRRYVFLSHTWTGANTPHERVVGISKAMQRLGWSIWIDESNLLGNVDASIANGIHNSSAVIIFLTREYCRKVNRAANCVARNDNCYNEFHYAIWSRKALIPVILDPSMKNPSDWSPGVIPMRLACDLYVDGCCHVNEIARRLDERLKQMKFRPNYYHHNAKRRLTTSRPPPTPTIYI